jgi:hypothetical protein
MFQSTTLLVRDQEMGKDYLMRDCEEGGGERVGTNPNPPLPFLGSPPITAIVTM